MTLQDIINNCPYEDLSTVYVYVEGKCVWDYKEGNNSILLISEEPCIEEEKVSLSELIQYSKDLELPQESITLECEYEKYKLNSLEWSTNKLLLSF